VVGNVFAVNDVVFPDASTVFGVAITPDATAGTGDGSIVATISFSDNDLR